MVTLSLDVKNLTKSFNGSYAVHSVNLSITPGAITAIIGPNGAGKTTLVDVITGFLRADSGQCYLGSSNITGLTPDRIAQRGVVRSFQHPRLTRRITVLENVMLARPHQRGEKFVWALSHIGLKSEESRIRAESLQFLDLVGLGHEADQLAGELSYGQQKLLGIACCAATEAPVLLLDEPISGLDPDSARKILSLLNDLKCNNRTLVFIEHDIAAVRSVADVVVVMDEGKIVIQGSPAEVLDRPEILEVYFG